MIGGRGTNRTQQMHLNLQMWNNSGHPAHWVILTDPVTLQQTLWWLIATHMGTRGRDEHRKLRFGDFFVGSTTDGHEYVEFSAERGTKTRTGETEKSTNENARVFKPKMWATPDMPSRCPVRLYLKFLENAPQICVRQALLFTWLSITRASKPPIGTRNSH